MCSSVQVMLGERAWFVATDARKANERSRRRPKNGDDLDYGRDIAGFC